MGINLKKQFFCFELEGKPVLGFNTGLDNQDFARAKLGRLITHGGFIVYPDGTIENWYPGGVFRSDSTMIIWGPGFPGENLLEIINSNEKDRALDAIRFWLKARIALEEKTGDAENAPLNGPAGAFMVIDGNNSPAQPFPPESMPFPPGTVFFPPASILKHTLETGSDFLPLESENWSYSGPDEKKGVLFSAAAMLYRVFSSEAPFTEEPFPEKNHPVNVFIPLDLAAPGIDGELAEMVNRIIDPKPGNEKNLKQGSGELYNFIGEPGSRPFSSWFKKLSGDEISIINAKRENRKNKEIRSVKIKRFLIRNAAIIAVAMMILSGLIFISLDVIRSRAQMPTTKGMTPAEVVNAYYGAFSGLDHVLMQACVINRAGKEDIDIVTNIYVINRVRQAYKTPLDTYIEENDFFGITDLIINSISRNGEEAVFEANYILWIPEGRITEGIISKDTLNLVLKKGSWFISNISRTRNPLQDSRNP